jgi:hypothetical protein
MLITLCIRYLGTIRNEGKKTSRNHSEFVK